MHFHGLMRGNRGELMRHNVPRTEAWGWLLLGLVSLPSMAATFEGDLTSMSLEELGNIQVTSVSRKSERLADAAASVFVITADDIRASGASSIPEVLRLAPNLHVARASAAGYAISARGFNGSNNSAPNKLLVMIDGRSTYSPLFSGMFWDVQDTVLEDIERIEVISGPGGTLWGINAVNGIINIITRSADDSHGALVVAEAGQQESAFAFRRGGVLGEQGSYRVYGKYADWDNTSTEAGLDISDAGHRTQVGFRLDGGPTQSRWHVNGNAYRGGEGQPAPGAVNVTGTNVVLGDVSVSGANLTTRWDRQLDDGASVSLQAYYDHTERTVPPAFADDLDIFDVQFQHSLKSLGAHSVVWGANYRYGIDRVTNSVHFAFLPADVNQKWASVFLQDEISLRDNLRLTLGTRFERNDYTGTEVLPNARLAWNIASDHMLWAAASRAVRAPSRLDRDAHVPGVPPFLLDGGPTAGSEIANVFEIGYRGQVTPKFSYSATAFHADYDHLRTLEIHPSGTFFIFGDLMEGRATGIEMWGAYQALPSWRLTGGFTALDEKLRLKPGSNDFAGPAAAGNDPSNTWQLRSSWRLAGNGELDLVVRHVGALAKGDVPAYTTMDARLGWRVAEDWQVSLSGRDLFGHHSEYGPVETRSEFGPGIAVKVVWQR